MSTELTTPIKIEIPGIGTIESADLYLKSEADKVIADLEESHKMEVEQLLMEIVKLKADYKEACDRLQTVGLIKDEQMAKVAKQREVISSLKCEIVNLERRVYAANRDARRTRY